MAIKVRALDRVFHNGMLYRPGAVFNLLPGYKPGKGMEVLGEDEVKVKESKAKKPKAPETFSELAHATPKMPDGLI